jgi:hypothetical protein
VRRLKGALLGSLMWLTGCAVGQGEGQVISERLYAKGCVDGPFDLRPDFFASTPHLDTQLITLRRGDKMEDLSDGVLISVYQIDTIVDQYLGQPVEVRLPAGVSAPGHAPSEQANPLVSLTLYLNDSCHEQDISLQAISGSITFDSLFPGDLSDRKKEHRLIEGRFDVTVADPRLMPADGSSPDPEIVSQVQGSFRFFFRRGTTAQAFP